MIFIHHGTGVESALAEVLEGKTLIHAPFKDLKVGEVKHLVSLFSQAHPQTNPCLLAGPLDDADPSTLDILLKRIEEPVSLAPELILWAYDLGSVPLTIRSRCGEKYHYAPQNEHEMLDVAKDLYSSLKEKEELEVMCILESIGKGEERGILEAYLDVLVENSDYEEYNQELKSLLHSNRITKAVVVGYFSGRF